MRRSLLAAGLAVMVVLGAIALSVQPVSGGISSAPPSPPSEITVSGSVQSFPPDGGAEVRVTNNVRLDGPSDVTITGQSGPIDTSITNAYVPIGMGATGPKLEAEVTGPLGGAVTIAGAITGTVAITAQSIAALNGRFCTPGAQKKQGITGTVAGLPPIPGDGGTGAQSGRTSISLAYPDQAGTNFIACFASGLSGGTNPDCALPAAGATTEGPQIPQGGVLEMEVSDAYVLRCLACTSAGVPSASTVVVSYVEQDCNQ
jgi:hypothetical protein